MPPAHATTIPALVIQVNALTAGHGAAVFMVVAQQCLVDFGAVGVWYVGELGLTVTGGVEAFIADMTDVVGFYQGGKAVPLAALKPMRVRRVCALAWFLAV